MRSRRKLGRKMARWRADWFMKFLSERVRQLWSCRINLYLEPNKIIFMRDVVSPNPITRWELWANFLITKQVYLPGLVITYFRISSTKNGFSVILSPSQSGFEPCGQLIRDWEFTDEMLYLWSSNIFIVRMCGPSLIRLVYKYKSLIS